MNVSPVNPVSGYYSFKSRLAEATYQVGDRVRLTRPDSQSQSDDVEGVVRAVISTDKVAPPHRLYSVEFSSGIQTLYGSQMQTGAKSK